MAVSLTISETLNGAAISDALAGGGTGLDFGSVVNNSFAPIVNKTNNTGRQDLYISHDATVDPITSLKCHIGQFGVLTGFAYGGARTAAQDYTILKNLGQASGASKNNADELSGGLWIDMDADVNDTNQFDQANRSALVKIFGDNATDGIDLASAFLVAADAMVYESAGEQLATAPVAGKIGRKANVPLGITDDQALGTHAHVRFRVYLPNSHAEGGVFQFEIVWSYSYTA